MVEIRKTSRRQNIEMLKRNKTPFVVSRMGNSIIIILLKRKREIYEFMVVSQKDKPFYKQAMDLQMGRVPQKVVNREYYRFMPVDVNPNQYFDVYEE